MKKIISIILVTIMLISVVPMTFAADLSTQEKQIITQLKAGAVIEGKKVYLPNEYISQAENYLLAKDITESQAQQISAEITKGVQIINTLDSSVINSNGTINVSKIPQSAKTSLVQVATVACNVVDLSFTISGTTVKIVDKAGSSVFTGEVVIKNTGMNNVLPIVIGIIALMLIAGVAVVIRRKMKA
ncbi:MAG: LPXTG cell wall anchor domain-containing protein [Clostridia bacterium]